MKTFLKILKWLGIVVGLFLIIFVVATYARWQRKFDAPYPDIHASNDSAVIAHGEYLVYGPAHCAECHLGPNDMQAFQKGEKTPLAGGWEFKLDLGVVHSANITSDKETGIGKFSDKEIARVIRHMVKPDGSQMIPFMEYQQMSDADLTAIVSYLRTVPPISHKVEPAEWNFLGKAVLAFMIKPAGPKSTPPAKVEPAVNVDYGRYLADDVSNCKGCHTQRSMTTGEYLGTPFGGGMKIEAATGEKGVFVVTPNISTNKKVGRLGYWDEQKFVDRFHQGVLIKETIMPWMSFQHYSDDDLRAIYRYLTSLPAVDNDPGPTVVREKS